MQPEQYAKMRSEEERHWWYRGNRAMVLALLAGRFPADRPLRWLDVACGTGGNLSDPRRLLGREAVTVGIDLDWEALEMTRRRGVTHVVRGTLDHLPFGDGEFDLVTCFEALYHEAVRDWRGALVGFARVLRPGGLLLSREPAFEALRGSHDVVVKGARRFRVAEVREAARAAGLRVVRCSYQNMVTFFPALVMRSWQRWRGREGEGHEADFDKGGGGGGVVGGVLAGWLGWEGRVLRVMRLPVGSSVVCLAERGGGG